MEVQPRLTSQNVTNSYSMYSCRYRKIFYYNNKCYSWNTVWQTVCSTWQYLVVKRDGLCTNTYVGCCKLKPARPVCCLKGETYIVDCSLDVFDCPAVVMCPVFWTAIIGFVIVICRLCSSVSNLVVVIHIKAVNVGSRWGCLVMSVLCSF